MNKKLIGTFYTQDTIKHLMVHIHCTTSGSLYHTTNASPAEAKEIMEYDIVRLAGDAMWRMNEDCKELGVDIHDMNEEFIGTTDNRIVAFAFMYGRVCLGGIAYNCRTQAFEVVGEMTTYLYSMLEDICTTLGDKWDEIRNTSPAVV